MTLEVILNLLTSQGFPIVVCFILGWYVKDQGDKHNTRIDKMQEIHALEMKEVTTAITNNTVALTKLCTIVEGGAKH